MKRVSLSLSAFVAGIAVATLLTVPASAGTHAKHDSRAKAAAKHSATKKVAQKVTKKKKAYFVLDFSTPKHERYTPRGITRGKGYAKAYDFSPSKR